LHFTRIVRSHASELEASGSRLNIGADTKGADVRFVPRFKIDRLPDAAGGGVPIPLLAYRLLGVVHRLLDPQDDQRLAPTRHIGQSFREIEFERRITAFMFPQVNAIAPA